MPHEIPMDPLLEENKNTISVTMKINEKKNLMFIHKKNNNNWINVVFYSFCFEKNLCYAKEEKN